MRKTWGAIRNRRAELGLTQAVVAEFAGRGVSIEFVSQVERLMIPSDFDGIADKLCRVADVLNIELHDLFPQWYLDAIEKQLFPSGKRKIVWISIVDLDSVEESELPTLDGPEKVLNRVWLRAILEECFEDLPSREVSILRMRYGFGEEPKTLEEVSKKLNVTRERIRQLEAQALSRLRHPAHARYLRDFLY